MCGGEPSNWQARWTKFCKIPGAWAKVDRNLRFIFLKHPRHNCLQTSCQLFCIFHLPIRSRFPSIKTEKPTYKVGDGGNRFLNQFRMNGDSTRKKIRCAMFRHAERPNGSRRVPTLSDGLLLVPPTLSLYCIF